MCTSKQLSDISLKTIFLNKDENGREIFIYNLKECVLTGQSLFYPNPLIYSYTDNCIYNPINEKILSLEKLTNEPLNLIINKPDIIETTPVFFFIYNTDNYYHFIYDTLPYLITYKYLKTYMNIKLLMNFPNCQTLKFYDFVNEFLNILNITTDDIIIASPHTLYNIYISTSYTHDINSNLPPRKEIYLLYKEIYDKISNKIIVNNFPSKIYISRRTWIHNDFTNIGTNYTSKRIMTNETELVNYLTSLGYSEIFTEKLSTIDKILMFNNASDVIGSIGGGISNVLFSKSSCNLTAICSPHFLDINKRFIYSLCNVNLNIFQDTSHSEYGDFLKFMRVKYKEIVGEIIEINGENITIAYLDEKISGWNNSMKYKTITINSRDCYKLDNGLNSAWKINMEKFKLII